MIITDLYSAFRSEDTEALKDDDDDNNNNQDNVYGAVIMAEPLRDFTWFI